jgi:hypothetical protein
MSNQKTVQITDSITGETIVRDLTASEIEELDTANDFYFDLKKEKQDVKKSALAKLAKLGLTEEEIASL